MIPPLKEREDRDRASFLSLKTGGKRNVVSHRLASLQNSFLLRNEFSTRRGPLPH